LFVEVADSIYEHSRLRKAANHKDISTIGQIGLQAVRGFVILHQVGQRMGGSIHEHGRIAALLTRFRGSWRVVLRCGDGGDGIKGLKR
jgi:hypothetical protein